MVREDKNHIPEYRPKDKATPKVAEEDKLESGDSLKNQDKLIK